MTASTPDEAAAMADAETYTRAMAERRKHHGALAAFVAEYDRRAAEIAALRAEVERSTELGQQAIAAEARAVRELEAENAGLRTELLTTQQILAHAERQRDEAEARLAAQQPVIDAAGAWVGWRQRTSQPEGLEHHLWGIQDAVTTLWASADDDALSGSVEAADTPPSGTSGHEADTPAEPDQLGEWCTVHQEEMQDHDCDEDTLGSLTGDCCPMMRDQSTLDCEQHHGHPIDCPDVLVLHGPQGPGLPIRDGGSSWVAIRYCPWCATDLCAREVAGTPAAEPVPDDEEPTAVSEPKPWTVRYVNELWEVTCSDGSLGGRFLREGDARVWADVAGPGPLTVVSKATLDHLRALAGAGAPTEPADAQHHTEAWDSAGGYHGWTCTCGVGAKVYVSRADAQLAGELHVAEAHGRPNGDARPDRESLLAVGRLISRARCAPATDEDLTVALDALDELLDAAALAGSADDTREDGHG